MSKLKYEVGFRFPAVLEVVQVEKDNLPYHISVVGGEETFSYWANEEEMEELILAGNPEKRKAALKEKIEKLEEELKQLEEEGE